MQPLAAAIFKPTPTGPGSLVESLLPLPLHRVDKHENRRQGWNGTIGLWKTSSRKIFSSWQHCKVGGSSCFVGKLLLTFEKNEHIIPSYWQKSLTKMMHRPSNSGRNSPLLLGKPKVVVQPTFPSPSSSPPYSLRSAVPLLCVV